MTRETPTVSEKNCVDRAREALKHVIDVQIFENGSHLFSQGEKPNAVYFVRSGSLQMQRAEMKSDSELCIARAGDVIGVANAVSGRSYDMSAVITKKSRVEVVSRNTFLATMISTPTLHLEVVRMLSIDLGRCYEVLRTLGPKTRNRRKEEVTL